MKLGSHHDYGFLGYNELHRNTIEETSRLFSVSLRILILARQRLPSYYAYIQALVKRSMYTRHYDDPVPTHEFPLHCLSNIEVYFTNVGTARRRFAFAPVGRRCNPCCPEVPLDHPEVQGTGSRLFHMCRVSSQLSFVEHPCYLD